MKRPVTVLLFLRPIKASEEEIAVHHCGSNSNVFLTNSKFPKNIHFFSV